jgi:uncharacterized protein with GYD domain
VPKYLFRIRYDSTAAQALIDNGGTARVDMARQLSESLDGSLEVFYFAFGTDDAIAIADLPGNEAAAAVALTVGSGSLSLETTVLLTAEEMDTAAKLTPSYSPPVS